MVSVEDWAPRGIKQLEPAAWRALRAGTASVTAGPGAGKSEFLAQRASYLLETGLCPYPQQILAISFKRSSAGNLHERVSKRIPEFASRLTSMTFDAFTKMLLDRFGRLLPGPWRLTGGYNIDYPSRRDVDDFLADVRSSAPPQFQAGIQAVRNDQFLTEVVGKAQLDPELSTPETAEEFAAREWWRYRHLNRGTAALDFILINRLVELIVRTSPQLHRALTLTYPFVFVDEFQDTTYAQYALMRTLFKDTDTTVTVVGDANQRIMGWAGAHQDAFAEFNDDFGAESITLKANHRSTGDLIDIQHRFARLVAPKATKQVSQVIRERGDTTAQVWSFSTSKREAETIARWIADDIAESGRKPSDYALIARQKVADMEQLLATAFERVGLSVRNDDADYGGVRMQDLLGYDLTQLFLDLLRMGASEGGNPQAWKRTVSTLGRLRAEETDGADTAIEASLSGFLSTMRRWCATHSIPENPAASNELAKEIGELMVEFIGLERIADSRFLAESYDDAMFVLNGIQLRLSAVLPRSTSWADVGDVFAQTNGVPLLTIHRSKGLEYHTVFFLALDDAQWWAYRRDAVESTMAFYVGLTRAMERIVFTYVSQRGNRDAIGEFYAQLEAAGVPILPMDGDD